MNKITKIFRYTVAIFFVTILISCSNLFEPKQGKTVPEKSYIKLNLGNSSRTVLPEIQNPDFTDLELKGAKSGETQITLGSWATETEMENAEIPVSTGIWSFILFANKGGSTFIGTTEKEIVTGQNTLSFTLVLSDSGTGTGSFTITLSFAEAQNADTVSYAIGTLENMDNTPVTGVSSQTLTPSNNTVLFSGSDITAGTYRAKIKFYTEENNNAYEIASYSELIQISSGFWSTANRTIENFEELYTVTYILNGGSFATGTTIPETFSRKTSVPLPESISKDYYTFSGWYTDENCTEGNKIVTTENNAGNINVYAKFTPIVYTITYDLVYSNITDSYTVEDNVTLLEIDEAEDIIIESYWYEDEDCESSIITGWTAGEKHSDITLYVEYTVNATITGSSGAIESKIRRMKRSGTIKKIGNIGSSNSSFTGPIKDALQYLSSARPTIKVSLDLSETTGLTELQGNAFSNCNNIKSIVLPDSLEKIGYESFLGCTSLEEMVMPFVGLSEFGYIFGSASNIPSTLRKVTITKGKPSFSSCTSLTEIILPNNTTSIKSKAFGGCSSLTNITIPDSVTSIGSSAFRSCTSLTNISIPDSVTSIGSCVFEACSSLTSISIPDSVTSIGGGAFYGCSSLTNITIPDSVTSIGGGAFEGCSSLTSITIPDSVTSIGRGAFAGCSSLTSITIPDSVTSIGGGAFKGCSSLTSISIPDSVTSIGENAFYDCRSLTSISIPDSVTTIGENAFYECRSLTNISIPDSVISIGSRAFERCSALKTITIPDSVTSIGSYAFLYCVSLWSITLPNNLTYIENAMFSCCKALWSINIPDSVTSIGSSAFRGCNSLTRITIPRNVTFIGEEVFYDADYPFKTNLDVAIFQDTSSSWRIMDNGSIITFSATDTHNNANLLKQGCTFRKITE